VLRMISPAGSPMTMKMLIECAARSSDAPAVQLQGRLHHYLDVQNVFFVGSGRTSLKIVFDVVAQNPSKNEVLIPAYTCFSVPSAVVRAGLRVRLCDINPDTLDFDIAALERAAYGKVLSVIPSNLFGLVSDLPEVNRIAKRFGVYVIDDAAQSLGASLFGAKSGTMGDVGIFSLGRGKNITSYTGGVIVTNSDGIALELSRNPLIQNKNVRRWLGPSSILGLIGYSVFLKPRLYWILNYLPFFQLGASKFDPEFKMEAFSKFQCALATFMLERLDEFNEQRRQNAWHLRERLKDIPHIALPRPLNGSYPVYLRFPILVTHQAMREEIYQELLREGIGVSKMYPTPIHRIRGIDPYVVNRHEQFSGADLVASSILTLPTHPIVTGRDLDLMVEVIKRCAR